MPAQNPKTLKQRALRAGGWIFFGYGVAQVLRLGSNLLMTRLLVPEMFGVMVIATMVSMILAMLSDLGVHQNIVQSRRGDDPAFLNTAWAVGVIRGVVLWVIAVLISLALYLADGAGLVAPSSVYAAPVLPLVIAVSSLSAIINGFISTNMSAAGRRLDQKRIIQIDLISQIMAMTVMIIFGTITRSIWALVAGSLVASMTRTLLSHTWMSGLPNRFHWEKKAVRELISFGKWIYFASIVSVLASQGDRLLLGGYLNGHDMGLYAIAILITGSIAIGVYQIFNSVALPTLSEVARNEPGRLREIYYKFRVPLDLGLLFLAGFLYACGQLVIDLLYDHRYEGAGGMLRVLALSLVALRYDVAHQIYLALGIPRYLAIIKFVQFVSLYTLVPLLYYGAGTQAAVWGVALHGLATVPLMFYLNAKLGLNDFRREAVFLLAFPVGVLFGAGLRALWG